MTGAVDGWGERVYNDPNQRRKPFTGDESNEKTSAVPRDAVHRAVRDRQSVFGHDT